MTTDRISEIKAKIDLKKYVADDLGEPKQKSSGTWFWSCPFGHKDSTPSFAVYADGHYRCYGACQKHGDIVNYVMERTGRSSQDAVAFLNGNADLPKFQRRPEDEAPPKKETVLTVADAERYHFNVGMVGDYLRSRHIGEEVINSNLIGGSDYRGRNPETIRSNHKTYTDMQGRAWNFECNWVALPYLFGNTVYSMNFRRDDRSCVKNLEHASAMHHQPDVMEYIRKDLSLKAGDDSKVSDEKVLYHCFGPKFYRPGTRVTAYGVHNVCYRTPSGMVYPYRPYCVITEGEFDALSCESLGYTALAMKAVAGVNVPKLLQNVRMILVATDNDEAGEKYADMLLKALGNDYAKVRKMVMPDKTFKDLNDLHKANQLERFLSRKPFYLEPIDPIKVPETGILF